MLLVLSMRGEYFFTVYQVTSTVFLVSSVGVGIHRVRRPEAFVKKPIALLFSGMMYSWVLAFVTLAVLNLTPLCVGQDNGDGMNAIGHCIMNTALVGVVYSIVVLAIVAAVAYGGGSVCRRMFANAGAQSK
jgi:hypothetical protein